MAEGSRELHVKGMAVCSRLGLSACARGGQCSKPRHRDGCWPVGLQADTHAAARIAKRSGRTAWRVTQTGKEKEEKRGKVDQNRGHGRKSCLRYLPDRGQPAFTQPPCFPALPPCRPPGSRLVLVSKVPRGQSQSKPQQARRLHAVIAGCILQVVE